MANAQWDMVNRMRRGELPNAKDKQLLETFPRIARGKLEEMIKNNIEFQSNLQDRAAYRAYMSQMHDNIDPKKPLTLPELMEKYQDSVTKLSIPVGQRHSYNQRPGFSSSNQ
ncbi:MAG: hypothetical protein MZV63_15560 [Marinilabiliales bacterium]|nr:hypothetical protein [Marinilabiliales bacterium]